MVHALHAVRETLQAEGLLVSIQPERFEAQIAVVSASTRLPVGRLINPAFNRYQVAAEAALARVVRDGSFALAGVRRHRYHVRLDRLGQLLEFIDLLGTPRPRLSPGTWPRLRALWRSRPPGTRIQVTDGMLVTALRKR